MGHRELDAVLLSLWHTNLVRNNHVQGHAHVRCKSDIITVTHVSSFSALILVFDKKRLTL